jgi:hypothetical protein
MGFNWKIAVYGHPTHPGNPAPMKDWVYQSNQLDHMGRNNQDLHQKWKSKRQGTFLMCYQLPTSGT